MSEKRYQNTNSILQKINNFGTALFIFFVLAGSILWLTGNLHFGPRGSAEADSTVDDIHGHGHQTDKQICQEHGVPESLVSGAILR